MKKMKQHRMAVKRALAQVGRCDTEERRTEEARRLWKADGAHAGDCLVAELDDLLTAAVTAGEPGWRAIREELAPRLEVLAQAFGAAFVEPALELVERLRAARGQKAAREGLAAAVLVGGVAPALRAFSERLPGKGVLGLERGEALAPSRHVALGEGPGWRACHDDPEAILHAARAALRAIRKIAADGAALPVKRAARVIEELVNGKPARGSTRRPARRGGRAAAARSR